jgi:uncharacterized caspase-like protein
VCRKQIQRISLLLGLPLFGFAVSFSQAVNNKTTPELYVLSIGVGHYHNYGSRDPRFAEKDAQDVASAFGQVAKNKFAEVHTTLLLNEQATQSGIAAAMKQIIRRARTQDTFVFFYSGHGKSLDEKDKESQFYLIPSDFDAQKDKLEKKGISAAQLQYWFIQVECEHQFVAFDASKSTGGFQDFKNNIDRENKRLAGLARRDIVILSIREWSFEFAHMHNGLLTYVLLRGLNGGAARPAGDIDARSLASYVSAQLPIVLKNNANAKARSIMREFPGSGRPFVYSSGEDFPLGSVTAVSRVNGDSVRGDNPNIFQRTSFISSEAELPANRDAVYNKPVAYIPDPKCLYNTQPSTANADRKGKDLALLIAGDNYDHWDRLINPVFDARTLAETLHDRYDFETEVLENPDNDCIDDAVKRYAAKDYKPDSQLFVFFAGHGVYLDNVKTGFIIAKDSRAEDDDLFGRTFTSHGLFRRMIGSIKCKHILLIMDACQSGTIDDGSNAQDVEPDSACDANVPEGNTEADLIGRLLSCKTRQFVTSGDKEYVPDGEPGKHSPFASQLLQALAKDSGGHQFVSLNEIYPVIQRVPRILPRRGYWGGDRGRGDFLFFLH